MDRWRAHPGRVEDHHEHVGVAAHRGEKGGAAGTKGLASALAMDAVRDSWHRRLKAVRDECEDLEGPMRQAAKDHGENEARIKAAMAAERTVAEPFEKGR